MNNDDALWFECCDRPFYIYRSNQDDFFGACCTKCGQNLEKEGEELKYRIRGFTSTFAPGPNHRDGYTKMYRCVFSEVVYEEVPDKSS